MEIDRPLFQPSPPVLEFVGFVEFSSVDSVLTLRNMDRVARRIRVEPIDSPFFKLSIPTNKKGLAITDSRVAPGMEIYYTVTFMPRERQRDYNYDLVCVTEREKFVVPLRARGTRATLSLPDALSFGVASVRMSSVKTIVVCILSWCSVLSPRAVLFFCCFVMGRSPCLTRVVCRAPGSEPH